MEDSLVEQTQTSDRGRGVLWGPEKILAVHITGEFLLDFLGCCKRADVKEPRRILITIGGPSIPRCLLLFIFNADSGEVLWKDPRQN